MEQIEINILVLGDIGVGKDNIINRYMFDQFAEEIDPYIDQYETPIIVNLEDKLIKLYMECISHSEEFRPLLIRMISRVTAFIFVFSVDNHESFNHYQQIENLLLEARPKGDYPIIAMANKGDLPSESWEITSQEMIEFFEKKGIKLFITSAKTNINVKEGINYLLKSIKVENKKKKPQRKKLVDRCIIE